MAYTKDRRKKASLRVFLELKTLQVLAQGHFTEVNEFCLGIILINTFKYTFLPPCKDNYAWEVYGDRHSLKTPSWKTATSCEGQRQQRRAETLSGWNADCQEREWLLLGTIQDWSKKCTSNVKVPMERPRYLSKSSADLQRIYNQITRHRLNLFTSRTNPHVMLMLLPPFHKDGSQHTTRRAATGLSSDLRNQWQIYLDLIFKRAASQLRMKWEGTDKV